ncbi:MAG: hypothetical protein AAFU71_14025 [Cyanobacteria bacterium J06632_22]
MKHRSLSVIAVEGVVDLCDGVEGLRSQELQHQELPLASRRT